MDQFETSVKLNVLPLGSYDMLIGLDWLEQHRVVLNCFNQTFTCVNNDGEIVKMYQFDTSIKINVLPLGSYDMLIGMVLEGLVDDPTS